MQYMEIFSAVNIANFIRIILIFLIYLLKSLIVGTCQNRLAEAVLTSTHNVCFGTNTCIRKIGIPQVYFIKEGYEGVYIIRICYPDECKTTDAVQNPHHI